MKKAKEASVHKGIRFPVSLLAELETLAEKKRRSFSGQVIYLCEKGMLELHQKKSVIKGKIGETLRRRGKMNEEQVRKTLRIQKKNDGRFGEIAVKEGFITQETLDEYLGDV